MLPFVVTVFVLLLPAMVPGSNPIHFGFMEKLFNRCNSPKHFIDSNSPILARGILPTDTNSELDCFLTVTLRLNDIF